MACENAVTNVLGVNLTRFSGILSKSTALLELML